MTSFQVTVIGFAVVTVALLGIEGVGRRRQDWPRIGDVFTVLVTSNRSRFLVMLGWWWLGWHFFVR
jgi:Family of unknown function (DUF6186)